jgi:hypothetical protein
MVKKKTVKVESETVRFCSNIRSRKHPDARCIYPATQGEFCARHFKNPTRFQEKHALEYKNSPSHLKAIQKIQKWWKKTVGYLRFSRQGPATNIPEISENKTDIYSLEPINSIPLLYRWSYIDKNKHIWLFDVRSLNMTRAQDGRELLLNPYTREPFSEKNGLHFQERCSWLRAKKYCTVHSENIDLSPDQLWHQKILDVTIKYDMLGYHTCLSWFEELSIRQLASFYLELWELWFYRLQLSTTVKKQVIPNWNKPDVLLFKWSPSEILNRTDKKWWQKTILDLLDRFVSSAELKEHRILGALYGMTSFAIVSQRVRQQYPWLVDMPEDS